MASLFWAAFDARYLQYRDCINALTNSSCRTPDGDNLTAGGMVWGLFAGVFAAWFVVYAARLVYRGLQRRWRAAARSD